jgi:exopolysaccharide production protein ExoQ
MAKRLAVFTIMLIVGIFLASGQSPYNLIFGFFIVSGLNLAVGLGTEFILGTFQPFAEGYRFAGTLQPNAQSINCSFLAIVSFSLLIHKNRFRLGYFFILFLALFFLIMTGSRTAFISCLISLIIYFLYITQWRIKVAIIFLSGIATTLIYWVMESKLWSYLFNFILLDRTSGATTLTGRIPLWNNVLSYVQDNIIMGSGYNSFWTPQHVTAISMNQGWNLGAAHSAYLDILLDLGIFGLIFYFIIMILSIKMAFKLYRVSNETMFIAIGSIILFCFLDGFLESFIPFYPSANSLLVLATITWLAFRTNGIKDRVNEQFVDYSPRDPLLSSFDT